jgi:hypothetical protein
MDINKPRQHPLAAYVEYLVGVWDWPVPDAGNALSADSKVCATEYSAPEHD